MGTEDLGGLTAYISDWLYYGLWLAWLVQACALTLVFGALLALQAVSEIKARPRMIFFAGRSAAAAALFFLFLRSAEALRGHRLHVSPRTYWNLGLEAAARGDYPRAISDFGEAEQGGENEPSFYLDSAEVLRRAGRPADARVQAEKVSVPSVGKCTILWNIFMKRKDYANALGQMKLAARLDPANPTLASGLAETYLREGNKIKALQIYRKTRARADLSPEFRKELDARVGEIERMP